MGPFINRRDVLKWGVYGTAVMVAGNVGGGCARGRRTVKTEPRDSGFPLRDLKAMLYLASLAPSSHNTQPWRVQIVNDTLFHLSIDAKRCLPVVDPDLREMTISMGAFIENLAIAAGAYGYRIDIRETAQFPTSKPLCGIALYSGRKREAPASLENLKRRRTVRKNLLGSPDLEAHCARAVAAQSGVLFIPMRSALAKEVSLLTTEAFAAQTADDAAQAELAHWIRLKRRDARQNPDGLTTESLEITGLAGVAVRALMGRDAVLEKRFRQKGFAQARQIVGEGAGWFVITSVEDSVPDWIDAGRRFERLALSCVPHNLSLHPMSQALETEDARRTLCNTLGIREKPQMLLRAGAIRGDWVPVSPRRPVSAFIV